MPFVASNQPGDITHSTYHFASGFGQVWVEMAAVITAFHKTTSLEREQMPLSPNIRWYSWGNPGEERFT